MFSGRRPPENGAGDVRHPGRGCQTGFWASAYGPECSMLKPGLVPPPGCSALYDAVLRWSFRARRNDHRLLSWVRRRPPPSVTSPLKCAGSLSGLFPTRRASRLCFLLHLLAACRRYSSPRSMALRPAFVSHDPGTGNGAGSHSISRRAGP